MSLMGCRGEMFVGDHNTEFRNRIVYLTVSPVAKKKRAMMIILDLINREDSRIMSFE